MKAYKTKTWQQETMGMRGSVKLFGINPFDYEWRPAGKRGKINNAFG